MELAAIRRKVDEMSAEFDGEDVLRPGERERLDEALTNIRELHQSLQAYTGPFDLSEPDEERTAQVEKLVERETGR